MERTQSGVYIGWIVHMVEYTQGGVYTWRIGTYTQSDIHTDGHIHGRTYTRWNIHMTGHTHEATYTRTDIQTGGHTYEEDIRTERHTHGRTYT